ncbi:MULTISPECIES: hypothetical protein [unclassified Rhizobium]|uniref:hypothetical protein n=1 Tax=unclassified Rhizobium TaxID=2613769 RepID=UPI0010517CD4|nr:MULTISPECIES: hypothetical protein [unclassified Rhizobium]TCM67956.1 hypothetical protein EV291_1314 [Rhizobium sp. BK068]
MKLTSAVVGAAYFGLTLVPSTILQAADLTPLAPAPAAVQTASGWTFNVTPYFWLAGISGDVGHGRLPSVHVDADFSDLFDHLDFAAMVTGEARYNRYSIFGDVLYTKFSLNAATPRGIVASDVNVSAKSFAGLIGVGYALIDDPNGQLDIVAGARLWSVDTSLSLNGGFLGGFERGVTKTWVDAMAGLRGNYFFTPHVFGTGWGLIGGGGAKVDWDVGAGLGYKFNDTISAVAGYRALGVDYDRDNFLFDVVEQGPILGLTVHF